VEGEDLMAHCRSWSGENQQQVWWKQFHDEKDHCHLHRQGEDVAPVGFELQMARILLAAHVPWHLNRSGTSFLALSIVLHGYQWCDDDDDENHEDEDHDNRLSDFVWYISSSRRRPSSRQRQQCL